MSLRERDAGAALEIPLEREGPRFVAKCDQDVEIPRPVLLRRSALAGVVRRKTLPDVGCAAAVEPAWIAATTKDVHKALEGRHAVPSARVVPRAPVSCRPNLTSRKRIRQLALRDRNLGCGSLVSRFRVAQAVLLRSPGGELRRTPPSARDDSLADGGRMAHGLPSVARAKRERRMVDQTGIEPVTS